MFTAAYLSALGIVNKRLFDYSVQLLVCLRCGLVPGCATVCCHAPQCCFSSSSLVHTYYL